MFALKSNDITLDVVAGSVSLVGRHVELTTVHWVVPVIVQTSSLSDLLDVDELKLS